MNNQAKVVVEPVQSGTLTVRVSGRFDFTTVPHFKSLYCEGSQLPQAIVIDLSETESIDSTALGMLLMLRRRAGGDLSKITLKNPNDDILKILTVSHLDSMFNIQKLSD